MTGKRQAKDPDFRFSECAKKKPVPSDKLIYRVLIAWFKKRFGRLSSVVKKKD